MRKNRVVGLIPVRLASTRLPGKALKDICGLPAIIHTYKRSIMASRLDDCYICTDSLEIKQVAEKYNCKVIMTGDHRNGTERIFEVAQNLDFDIIINIQGDEVLVNPEHINAIAELMLNDSKVEYALGLTDYNKSNTPQDFKGIVDLNNNLIYCSRSDIPNQSINVTPFKKVVFTIGFTFESIKQFVNWPETPLERAEPNEFLRIIEHGHKIKTTYFDNAHISLDTLDDLNEITSIMKTDTLVSLYM